MFLPAIFGTDDRPLYTPCKLCKHFSLKDLNCKAFPDGIPPDIAFGENTHTEPFEGDRGIQFEVMDFEAKGEVS